MNEYERLKHNSREAVAGMTKVGQASLALASFAQSIGRASRQANCFGMKLRLININHYLNATLSFTLPTFTILDRLKDCYGWLYCEVAP